MKKKLCFVITCLGRAGAERVMSILVNQAASLGYDISLVLTSTTKIGYELNENVKVYKIAERVKHTKKGVVRAIEKAKILKNILLEIHPDLVVSFLTICNIYVSLALKNTDIPFVVSERNLPDKDCPGIVMRMMRDYCYQYADGFVFQTTEAQGFFNPKIQDRSVVIPNPVKSNLPIADIDNAKNKIVAAARLMPQKNYPMMLRAFRLFLNDHPDYTLHIFGDGAEKEALLALTQELSISENVIFEGNVPDLHERIRDAKMFVLSSDYEGISNSLLEALAMGLPCVSTDCPVGGSKMLIGEDEAGLLTPVGDEVALYQAMKRIAEDDELRRTLAGTARRVRELYSEKIIVDKYFTYFDEIISKKRQSNQK